MAHSDQAAYITQSEAELAYNILNNQSLILDYCAPCDAMIPELVEIKSLQNTFTNYEHFWEIVVNNQGIDLAYTYIYVDDLWINLANYIDIEVFDVPMQLSELDIEQLQINGDYEVTLDFTVEELNFQMQNLLTQFNGILESPQRLKLVETQNQWIEYFDAQMAWYAQLFLESDYSEYERSLIKQRIEVLNLFYEVFEEY
ncbi:hypothetical protein [Marinicellulosiphila megalodicopiae]|uniref:hypothetical protein n=1 Tax=Marinicellulosiphila megalodicopiae TaxID=2724896 RepID=UPI003BAE3672